VERIYQRVGSRILWFLQGVHFLIGFGLSYLCILGYLRFVKADGSTYLWLTAAWAGDCAVIATVAGWGILRAARPLIHWLDGPRGLPGR